MFAFLIRWTLYYFVAVVFCFIVGETIDEPTFPTTSTSEYFYIQDYSGVFAQETEKYIFDQARELDKKTTAQVVVMAMPDTMDQSLEMYSLNTANSLQIGTKEKDNGILIFFTTTEPHVRLEVGKGLEGLLPDAKAGRILDNYAVEPKNSGKWNMAAANTFTAVVKEIYKDAQLPVPESLVMLEQEPPASEGKTMADLTPLKPIPANEAATLEDRVTNSFAAGLVFWFVALFLKLYFYFGGGMGGGSGGSGGYRSGSSYSSGGGSSYGGGGGSFGGGGASR